MSLCEYAHVPASLTCASFRRHLHERFLLQVDGMGAFDMELVEAAESQPTPEAGRCRFSVVFRAEVASVLPQRVYGVEHPEMGRLELFLVPVAQDADGVRYEAVFA